MRWRGQGRQKREADAKQDECDSGICAAALACSHKLLKQEAPYEIPMPDPSLCQGCGDCVQACPLKAMQIVKA